ncbi:MAG: hypothetical protein RBU29_06070 [bacterium]|jgi:hypothetical protein|nr:hypothetical protein [bacterium]
MKAIFGGLMLVALLCSPGIAQNISFTYVTEIPTAADLGMPYAVATDAQGGLYYTLYSTGTNLSGCFYIANPLSAPPADQHAIVDGGWDFTIPNGRGMTGVDVDSQGNVYVSTDTGTAASSSIRKFGPAPDFELDFDFGAEGIYGNRFESVGLMTDSIVMGLLFDQVIFYDAQTGEVLHTAVLGENYHRDVAYNAATQDIYLSRNRTIDGYPVPVGTRLSGGSPTNLAGYTSVQINFIPQGGQVGQYGTKLQKLGYDPVNNLIMVVDSSGMAALGEGETYQTNIAFYNPSNTQTPVARINGSDSTSGPLRETGDAEVAQINGETYVFITDRNVDLFKRILVYKMQKGTEVGEWTLF